MMISLHLITKEKLPDEDKGRFSVKIQPQFMVSNYSTEGIKKLIKTLENPPYFVYAWDEFGKRWE